jgi:hypothetical protein
VQQGIAGSIAYCFAGRIFISENPKKMWMSLWPVQRQRKAPLAATGQLTGPVMLFTTGTNPYAMFIYNPEMAGWRFLCAVFQSTD